MAAGCGCDHACSTSSAHRTVTGVGAISGCAGARATAENRPTVAVAASMLTTIYHTLKERH
jgi:hypothetical protein